MSFFSDLPTDPTELAKLLESIKQIEKEKDAHYAAIGRVAANWAQFEHMIDDRTAELGKVPIVPSLCLTANIIGLNKLDAYMALAKAFGSSQTDALIKLKRDAKGLSEQRNRVVHDPWLLLSPKERAFRLEKTARGTLRAELVPMPTADVLKLAEHIEAMILRFADVANSIGRELATSPDIQSQ